MKADQTMVRQKHPLFLHRSAVRCANCSDDCCILLVQLSDRHPSKWDSTVVSLGVVQHSHWIGLRVRGFLSCNIQGFFAQFSSPCYRCYCCPPKIIFSYYHPITLHTYTLNNLLLSPHCTGLSTPHTCLNLEINRCFFFAFFVLVKGYTLWWWLVSITLKGRLRSGEDRGRKKGGGACWVEARVILWYIIIIAKYVLLLLTDRLGYVSVGLWQMRLELGNIDIFYLYHTIGFWQSN